MKDGITALSYMSVNRLNEMARQDPKLALRKLTSEFESLLWYEILKGLDRTVMKAELIPETFERRLYQEFLYQEVARSMAGRPRGFGDYLYQQLIKSPYLQGKTKIPNKLNGGV